MLLRIGYELTFNLISETHFLTLLGVHSSKVHDIVVPDHTYTNMDINRTGYWDSYGNWCNRFLAPKGNLVISTDAVIRVSATADREPKRQFQNIEELPNDALLFLLPSRYCDTEFLSEIAWDLFEDCESDFELVTEICEYIADHMTYDENMHDIGYTAFDVLKNRKGKSRDYAHLAIALCRCMNIPARFCSGYLKYHSATPGNAKKEFSGWFEAYLDNQWQVFDAASDNLRTERVLVARGRDAADTAMTYSFGPAEMASSKVWIEEVEDSFINNLSWSD